MSRTDSSRSRVASWSVLRSALSFFAAYIVVCILCATLVVDAYVAVVADANVNGRVWTSIDGSQNWTMSVQTYSPLFNVRFVCANRYISIACTLIIRYLLWIDMFFRWAGVFARLAARNDGRRIGKFCQLRVQLVDAYRHVVANSYAVF